NRPRIPINQIQYIQEFLSQFRSIAGKSRTFSATFYSYGIHCLCLIGLFVNPKSNLPSLDRFLTIGPILPIIIQPFRKRLLTRIAIFMLHILPFTPPLVTYSLSFHSCSGACPTSDSI